MEVLVINGKEVRTLLSMKSCITVVEKSLISRANNRSNQPLREAMWLPDKSGLLGSMPSYSEDLAMMATKLVSVFPNNHSKGLPSHMGAVLLFDSESGSLLSILDAEEITAIRTAAASAVATNHLAKTDASSVALIGTGVQGKTHLAAMKEVREIKEVQVWSRNAEHAKEFIASHAEDSINMVLADSIQSACSNADIICTTTAATDPILFAKDVKAGAHINAVGACTPNARELGGDLMAKASIFTDAEESLRNEAGEFITPLKNGEISEGHFKGEIGDVLIDKVAGRTSDAEITVYESLGIGVEDLFTAHFIYEKAREQQVGSTINL